MRQFLKIPVLLLLLQLSAADSSAICLIPSDQVLGFHCGSSASAPAAGFNRYMANNAGLPVADDSQAPARYYICGDCKHVLHVNKPGYVPLVSGEHKHCRPQHVVAIRDTSGVRYLLHSYALI